MTTIVLDASAVLAMLYREPGGEVVAEQLDGAILHSVNLAEVLQKTRQRSVSTQRDRTGVVAALRALGVQVVDVLTVQNAARTAEIWSAASHLGLSLGDRCCLAVAGELPDAVAVTADRAWTELPTELGIAVRCIR